MNSLQQPHEIRLRGLAGGAVAARIVRVDDPVQPPASRTRRQSVSPTIQ
jgi:hypothetical protein